MAINDAIQTSISKVVLKQDEYVRAVKQYGGASLSSAVTAEARQAGDAAEQAERALLNAIGELVGGFQQLNDAIRSVANTKVAIENGRAEMHTPEALQDAVSQAEAKLTLLGQTRAEAATKLRQAGEVLRTGDHLWETRPENEANPPPPRPTPADAPAGDDATQDGDDPTKDLDEMLGGPPNEHPEAA
jgi:hypothetical protein